MISLWHLLVAAAPLVAIGHRCAQVTGDDEQCCEIATHEQAWPGAPYSPICDAHLAKAQRLAELFCFVLPVRPLAVWRRPELDDAEQRFRMMELN